MFGPKRNSSYISNLQVSSIWYTSVLYVQVGFFFWGGGVGKKLFNKNGMKFIDSKMLELVLDLYHQMSMFLCIFFSR